MGLNTINHPGQRLITGLTATGSSQATAYPLVGGTAFHEFTTVAASTGCVLPSSRLPITVTISNAGASALSIYPPSGGTIDGGSVDAAALLAALSSITYWAAGPLTWYSTSPGGGGIAGLNFGAGQDADPLIASGTTTLADDAHYANLTISGTGKLVTNGFRVFVAGMLDLSAAPAGAIAANGAAAGAASGATGGPVTSLASIPSGPSVSAGNTGKPGGNGSATNGAGGTAATTSLSIHNGGPGKAGGAGGVGGTPGSGTAGAGGAAAAVIARRVSRFEDSLQNLNSPIGGGLGGGGGGGGGGDGTNSGGGGGGGGAGGNIVYISARTISRGTNATAGVIQAKGTPGSNGAAGVGGNAGGGGGGGGGSGGWIYLCYGHLLGAAIPNGLDASSGAGGSGGNLHGGSGAANGGGGNGGAGGRITTINLTTGVAVETNLTATSAAASGAVGGAATTTQANL